MLNFKVDSTEHLYYNIYFVIIIVTNTIDHFINTLQINFFIIQIEHNHNIKEFFLNNLLSNKNEIYTYLTKLYNDKVPKLYSYKWQ